MANETYNIYARAALLLRGPQGSHGQGYVDGYDNEPVSPPREGYPHEYEVGYLMGMEDKEKENKNVL